MEHEAYLDMAASEERHWWFRGRRQILDQVIGGLNLPAGARILELGSGTGGNLAMLSSYGVVTAVEMDETARALAAAKAGGADYIFAGTLPDRLPAFAEPFDLICMFDVLEHIEDDEATLKIVLSHLAPGGRAVITVPAFARLWGPHDAALHHKRRYEKSELQQKLLAAGFSITQLTYTNMLLFPAALAARLLDKLCRPGKAAGTSIPPVWLNEVFASLFGSERHLIQHVNLPFGLSLLAVIQAAAIR
ncbi:MAG: class I SAM-dependent methyltransferase [Acidocella sp.]|nr:class I SAM-dependent methyltransferase [Acidocella sp.]